MNVLVLGATGATGRLLVKQLLDRGASVRAVVRKATRLEEAIREMPNPSIVEASISETTDPEIKSL